ncbi:hypothetical protein IPA_04205 [Ignicoccus pacificus DSM 13166]|uniref:DUF460 domain-containing protein n=1 Tax=Ignicoccus pacificus DSM 13166 TaxID=940294 RepID=A0A977KB26_9CREN|nr:hypothetical protein IPA_04205 [Ignicoccus pacificus DSM 13166]
MKCPIAGVDLEPGSPPGIRGRYSLVIIDCNGNLIISKQNVPFKKLLRYLWEYKPQTLALDNVMELGSDKEELIKVLSLFPPETEIVQVTRLPNNIFVDIKKLASTIGIEVPPRKLGPLDTAYLAALLAQRGIGSKLKTFEEKTKIIVTKGRTPRAGGSSMDRFKRAVRNAVSETIAEIKQSLDKAGLDYDVIIDKSDGAIEKAIFTVYAPRSKLQGVVKPVETSAVRVMIRPVVARKIDFLEEVEGSKYLIVGYDPGIESGLAILDLDGNVLLLTSSKELDRGDVISLISKFGIPLIVASDTNPPPHSVKKLAAHHHAMLYVPRTSMSIKEKERIASLIENEQGVKVEDSHQRDALAAAYKAYQAIQDQLRQIDSYLDRIDLEMNRERVKAEVIKGRPLAEVIEEELDKIISNQQTIAQSIVDESRKIKDQQPSMEHLAERIRIIEAENASLRLENEELKEKIKTLEVEMKILKSEAKLLYEGEIDNLKRTLRSVTEKLEICRNELEDRNELLSKVAEVIMGLSKGDYIPAVVIDKMTFNMDLEELESKNPENHHVIYVKYLEDLNERMKEYLSEQEIVLIAKEYNVKIIEELKKYDIPVLTKKPVLELGSAAVFEREILDEWEEMREKIKEERELTEDDIEKLIEEYRIGRWG